MGARGALSAARATGSNVSSSSARSNPGLMILKVPRHSSPHGHLKKKLIKALCPHKIDPALRRCSVHDQMNLLHSQDAGSNQIQPSSCPI